MRIIRSLLFVTLALPGLACGSTPEREEGPVGSHDQRILTTSYDDATIATSTRSEAGISAVLKDHNRQPILTLDWVSRGSEGVLKVGPEIQMSGVSGVELDRSEPTLKKMNDAVHALWRLRPQAEVDYSCSSCFWECTFWDWSADWRECAHICNTTGQCGSGS